MKKKLGYALIALGVVVLGSLFYVNSQYREATRVFSPKTVLVASWEDYKKRFINQDGRVLDYSQNELTTSEAQSYALLRSVWIDDRETFDKVWKFTKENMKRPDDYLFVWRWGLRPDGSYGVISDGGENAASDADTDIALALILASRRWSDVKYLDDSKNILNHLWELEVAEAQGKNYLIAGNWAKNDTELVINPSYFAPYAWRIFAVVDDSHDWKSLIDPSYDLLARASFDPIDKQKAVGIPPDWVVLDRQTGQLKPYPSENLSTNYSFDAARIPWRIAVDYLWNGDSRAYEYLQLLGFFNQKYNQDRKLVSGYSHDGQPLTALEHPIIYATSIGYFMVTNPDAAGKIYQEKIIRLYSNAQNGFREDIPYYEQNWLWFGVALYNNYITDFQG